MLAALMLVVMVVFAGIAMFIRRKARRPEGASRELRLAALQRHPGDFGLATEPGEPFAVLMDLVLPGAVATVVAAANGEAAIYLSSGGGVIGGAVEAVREAAVAFVRESAKHRASLRPTTSFHFPLAGEVKFFVSTPDGVLATTASEQAVVSGKSPLAPLFVAGQAVIAALREATPEG
jgi:hypothetical protein